MITPFENDGSIDFKNLEKLTDNLIQKGIDYLVVLGTTSEAPTLSEKEKLNVIEAIKNTTASRVPLVIGAGGNSTSEVVEWIKKIGSDGFAAYLSVVPYYNKPSQTGMKAHFSAIASSADIPLILYNVPGRTSSNINAETTLELAHDLGEHIAGVKEASGDLSQIMQIIKDKPENFSVLSGDDAMTLPLISIGADGVISVIGNALPEQFSNLVNEALAGKMESAIEKHYSLFPFYNLLFKEGNPCGVKALMEILGQGKANLRLPLVPATSELFKEIEFAVASNL